LQIHKQTFWVNFFISLLRVFLSAFLNYLKPTFSFIAATKLNVLDRVLFYAQLDPRCLREEGAAPVRQPAHPSQPLSHSAEALPSLCNDALRQHSHTDQTSVTYSEGIV
jgi:hypothetical protein